MKVTAECRRSGKWWAIEVRPTGRLTQPLFTQARRLEQVPEVVADAVALALDIDESDVDVVVEAHTDEDTLVAHARAAREEADRAADLASAKMREAARCLIADQYTVRDAGRLLGVSPQRVSQLVDA
jgi:hypothetical protein